MRSPMSPARRPGAPVVIALVALLLVSWAGTALAHSDEGEMEITRVEQTGPGSVELEVGVVYANDEHQAADAAVTATLSSVDGTTVGPVELTSASENGSLFAATIDVPAGSWSVQVTSTNPQADATASIEVDGEPAQSTSTAAPPTTAAPTTAASTDDPGEGPGEAAASDEPGAGDEPTGLLIAAAVVAVAVLGGALYLASRRRGAAGDAIE